MKKTFCMLIAGVIASSLFMGSVMAESLGKNDLRFNANGAYLIYSKGKMPYVDQNHRTLIPLRLVSDLINGTITWDQKTKTVDMKAQNFGLIAKLGEKAVTINGKKMVTDTSLTNNNGTVLVPAKWIADGLGASLKWDAVNNIVSLNDKRFFQSGHLARMNNESNKDTSFDPGIVPDAISYGKKEGEEQLKIHIKNMTKNTYTNGQIQDHLLVYISPNHYIEEGTNGDTNSDRSGIRLIDKFEPQKSYDYFLPVGRLDRKQLMIDTPQYAFIRYFKYK